MWNERLSYWHEFQGFRGLGHAFGAEGAPGRRGKPAASGVFSSCRVLGSVLVISDCCCRLSKYIRHQRPVFLATLNPKSPQALNPSEPTLISKPRSLNSCPSQLPRHCLQCSQPSRELQSRTFPLATQKRGSTLVGVPWLGRPYHEAHCMWVFHIKIEMKLPYLGCLSQGLRSAHGGLLTAYSPFISTIKRKYNVVPNRILRPEAPI